MEPRSEHSPTFIAHATDSTVSESPLASIFGAPDVAADDRLEVLLQTIVDRARAAWPDLDVPTDAFIRYLADRAGEPSGFVSSDVLVTLAALHTTDLFLACACSLQQPPAIAIFEARFLGNVDQALLRIGMPAWAVDETKQVLRCRFFIPRGEQAESSIADYSGRGSLQAWVSAAAVNAAFRVVQTPKKQTEVDSFVMKAVSAPIDDLELDYLKRRFSREFEDALTETFASLSPRERNILRCYHLEGTGIDGVAALYRVHRVTASRWVKRITREFLERTRARMVDRQQTSRDEIASVLKLIESRVDAILRSVLAASVENG